MATSGCYGLGKRDKVTYSHMDSFRKAGICRVKTNVYTPQKLTG